MDRRHPMAAARIEIRAWPNSRRRAGVDACPMMADPSSSAGSRFSVLRRLPQRLCEV